MGMNQFFRVIRRWLLVILVTTTLALGVSAWRVASAESTYESDVKLQLTAPQSENVAIYDTARTVTNVRDEMTVARNNFGEILQSREIFERTSRQLNLKKTDADYVLELRPLRDSDFLIVAVQSKDPKLVGQIVNVHVNAAIAYYGEVRAKPATAAKSFLAEQVATADKRVRTAESSLADFQVQNKVTIVSDDLATNQKVIETLLIERNRVMMEGPNSRNINAAEAVATQLRVEREAANADGNIDRTTRYDQAIASYTQVLSNLLATTNPLPEVDQLITQYRAESARLASLLPRYNTLQEELKQARSEYQQLLSNYSEAVLKEQTVQAASFIQVIEPGIAPVEPVSTRPLVVLTLALLGGLILGSLLAFLLDYLFPRQAPEPRLSVNHADRERPRAVREPVSRG